MKRFTLLLLSFSLLASGCATLGGKTRSATTGPKPLPIDPPSQQKIQEAVDRGVAYLVQSQQKGGWWGRHAPIGFGRDVYCPAPYGAFSFRVATSALCVSALIEANSGLPEAKEARRKGEDWLLENAPNVTLCNPVLYYNNWAHAFALQALVDMLEAGTTDPEREQLIRSQVEEQVRRLVKYQARDGGWSYYGGWPVGFPLSTNPTTFMTATVLIALHDAHEAGFEVSRKDVIEPAMYAIRRGRRPDFSYGYSMRSGPTTRNITPAASMGRAAACNMALYLWGAHEVTFDIMQTWLDRLYARNGWQSMARKTRNPHEGYWGIAGYFYYYGHYYSARCAELFPPEQRPYHQGYLAHLLLPKQEKDGSWFDFPAYGYSKPYGTAFAVSTMVRCLRTSDETMASVQER